MNIFKLISQYINPDRHCHKLDKSVLFVLKKRGNTWGQVNPHSYHSSGLLNSATFILDMLKALGVRAHLVEVGDGNDIDREVFKFNPDIVILEAIWCPPYKVRELVKLHHHKHRQWIVRNHSELPFLSMEGIAMDWLIEYAAIKNVHVSCNSPVAAREVQELIFASNLEGRVIMLPNYYPVPHFVHCKQVSPHEIIDVGCFGAIRPLKNHLEQAVAAVIYARDHRRHLRFHINATRIEGNADPILRSIRAIFSHVKNCELVEHKWEDHKHFLHLCRKMDVGLQVSFSETFNIVSADLVSQGVPVVSSDELPWMPSAFQANPTSAVDISLKIHEALREGAGQQVQGLREYSRHASHIWLNHLNDL